MISVIHWAMIGIAVISSWFGIRRGFLQEGLSLITWIAAVAIALIFADKLGTLLADLIETSSVRVGISFFILLICTLAVGGMVSNLLGKFIEMTGLTGTDKVLGMVFGFVRGGVICLVIIAGLNYWGFFKEDDWWTESMFIQEGLKIIERYQPLLEHGEELIQEHGKDLLPGIK